MSSRVDIMANISYKWDHMYESKKGDNCCNCPSSQKSRDNHKVVCDETWKMRARWNKWAANFIANDYKLPIDLNRGDYSPGLMLFILQHSHHALKNHGSTEDSDNFKLEMPFFKV